MENPRKPPQDRRAGADELAADPDDPVQSLESGEVDVDPLEVEAEVAELADDVIEPARDADEMDQAELARPGMPADEDIGELYGVHQPGGEDHDLADPDDEDGYQDATLGENWLEALESHAAEGGPADEQEIVVIDETDEEHPHHSTESGDRPVADKGSGGVGGL